MKTLKIYDPATNSAKADVSTEQVELENFLNNLDKCAVQVERFNLTRDPAAYAQEPVAGVLKEKGPDALPVVMLDDEIINVGEYPDLGKLAGLLSASKLPFEMPDCTGCRGCD